MPIGPRGEKRPADEIAAAVMVAKIATGEIEEEYVDSTDEKKQKAGKLGGKARAESLSPERRREIVKAAAGAKNGNRE